MTCGAYTERYTGKGKERTKHAGACIYERGHDGDHCPPSLANVDWVPVSKEEMAQAKSLVEVAKRNVVSACGVPHLYDALIKLIEGWPNG